MGWNGVWSVREGLKWVRRGCNGQEKVEIRKDQTNPRPIFERKWTYVFQRRQKIVNTTIWVSSENKIKKLKMEEITFFSLKTK